MGNYEKWTDIIGSMSLESDVIPNEMCAHEQSVTSNFNLSSMSSSEHPVISSTWGEQSLSLSHPVIFH